MKLNDGFDIRLVLVLSLILGFGSVLHAQSGFVLAKSDRKPVIGVSISISNGKVITISDDDGKFTFGNHINIFDKDTLCFTCVGFETLRITWENLKKNSNCVFLDKKVAALQEITVLSKKEQMTPYIRYEKLSLLPIGVTAFGSFIADEKIYLLGGDLSFFEDSTLKAYSESQDGNFLDKIKPKSSWFSYSGDLYIYDLLLDKWKVKKGIFRKRAYHNAHSFKNKVYLLGGKSLSTNRRFEYLDNTIEIYDRDRDTVYINDVNPHQAINFASFIYDDNIIVMGGSIKKRMDGKKKYTNKAHLFNLTSGYWYEIENMLEAKESKGIIIDNMIYLVGGYNDRALSTIESYNISTGKWNRIHDLQYPVERPGITSHAGIIYIYDKGIIQVFNTTLCVSDTYMIDIVSHSGELFYEDGKLYIVGGYNVDDNDFTTTPLRDLYSVDIIEFKHAKIYNTQR